MHQISKFYQGGRDFDVTSVALGNRRVPSNFRYARLMCRQLRTSCLGYEASNWWGLCAPKNTPTEIVDKLNSEINA